MNATIFQPQCSESGVPEAALRRQRERLWARIQRRYETLEQRVSFQGVEIPILRVADPDLVLQQSVAAEAVVGAREASVQPYWAEAWESAVVAGRLLSQYELAGRRVLDLGCGLGVAGIAAAVAGASVLFADAVPAALLFARWNSWPWRTQTQVRRVDWRRDRLVTRFHVIIGADVLYQNDDWDYLDTFWRNHLAEDGRLLLTEPSRSSADHFPNWLASRGWEIRRASQPSKDRRRPIRIYEAVRC